MDYGYTHPTVVLLGCFDAAGCLYIVDEHAERFWIPQRHAQAIKAMFARHGIYSSREHLRADLLAQYPAPCPEREALWHHRQSRMLAFFAAGTDIFGRESDGRSIAQDYRALGLRFSQASKDRVSGWSAISQRLGDTEAGILPSLFIHKNCKHLLECLPCVQHDPDRPGDVLKSNLNEEGVGGDDPADALRYLVTGRSNAVRVVRLRGL